MGPSYEPGLVQELVRRSRYRITGTAAEGARALGFDAQDIRECLLELSAFDFYKTMPSNRFPDRWQDVYRRCYLGVDLYLKLQVVPGDDARGLLVIISFKEL